MKKNESPSKLTDLMALTVFALFAVCLLSLLLTGAEVYRDLVRRGGESYALRTAAQYVTTRVRQGDGSLSRENFAGCDALVYTEQIEGERYLTRIYCYDGWLRELFTPEEGDFSPADGEKILEAEALTLEQDGPVLTARITVPGGGSRELVLLLRSGKEGLP